MAAEVSFLRGAIEILLRAVVAGMFLAQFWAASRVLRGQPLLPDRPARTVPWTGRSLFLVVLLYVALSLVVRGAYELVRPPRAGAVAGASAGPARVEGREGAAANAAVVGITPPAPPRDELSFTEKMALVSVVNLLAVVLVPPLLRLTSGATLADLGLGFEHAAHDAMVGLVAFLLLSPWVYAVNALALLFFSPSRHPLEDMIRQEFTPAVALLAMASAVVLAPAAEELIFRGVLLGWLSRPRSADRSDARLLAGDEAGPACAAPPEPARDPAREWRAIVASSLPFAIVHATEMPAPFAIFVLSLGLGLVARRTGGLVAPFVLHAAFNGFSTMMLLGSML